MARRDGDHYRGRKVLVTGGSSGIGLATARQLVGRGADVWISGRTEERLEAARRGLEGLAGADQRCGYVVHDVGDRDATERAVAEVLDRLGHLDIVINNAGATYPARFLETPPEVFGELIRTNYLGAVNTTRAALPSMIERGAGHLGFVSSMAGFLGVYGYTAYCASKFALVGFAEALRAEVDEHGIGVTVVHPPDTDTPMLEAENRIKPPETAAISGTVEPLAADDVAAALLRAMARGRADVVPGLQGTAVRVLHRHAPWLVRHAMARALRRHRGTG